MMNTELELRKLFDIKFAKRICLISTRDIPHYNMIPTFFND
jgi:hypothetical protein